MRLWRPFSINLNKAGLGVCLRISGIRGGLRLESRGRGDADFTGSSKT
jgi:hypothetical protein